jgi:hypothetical protein
MECEAKTKKAVWIVRWHVAYDSRSYYVRFEEWMGTENNVIRLTKTEPKQSWRCEVYETEEGISKLTTLLFADKPIVVFATGKMPEKLRDVLRQSPPSTYYLAVM